MAFIHCSFPSKTLGMGCVMNVILPDRTDPISTARPMAGFPVLYLLHGLSDDHTAWCRFTSIERYVSGLNLAVVMPSVHRSFYTDMAAGPRYWTFISEEVPAVAGHLFPLSRAREDTFAAGLSMGGYGAFKLALRRPEQYAAAASLSGAFDIVRWLEDEAKEGRDEMRNVFGPAETARGGADDLFHLATQAVTTPKPWPAFFQWCGTEDYLYTDNVRFRDHGQAAGLPIEYSESPGGHDWARWDEHIQRVIAWLKGVAPQIVRR